MKCGQQVSMVLERTWGRHDFNELLKQNSIPVIYTNK